MKRLQLLLAIMIISVYSVYSLEPMKIGFVYTAGTPTSVQVQLADNTSSNLFQGENYTTGITPNSSGIIVVNVRDHAGSGTTWADYQASNVNTYSTLDIYVNGTLYAQYRLDALIISQAQNGILDQDGNLTPAESGSGNIGSDELRWNSAYFEGNTVHIGPADGESSDTEMRLSYDDNTNSGSIAIDDEDVIESTKDLITLNKLVSQEIGNNNTAFGTNSSSSNTGQNTTTLGYSAGINNTGNEIVAVGYESSNGNSSNDLTAIGAYSGYNNSGTNVTAIGHGAAYDNTGTNLIAIGKGTGSSNTASSVIIIGPSAGSGNTGSLLTSIGSNAGRNNSGISLNAIGYESSFGNSGDFVVSIGHTAAKNNSGYHAIALGLTAARNNTGDSLTAIGINAGNQNSGAQVNAIGGDAGNQNSGNWVDAIGRNAARENSGNNVIAIGQNAGWNGTNGNTRSNVVLLGNNTLATADNQVVIGNSSITETQLRGATLVDLAGGGTQNIQVDGTGKLVTGTAAYTTGTNIGDLANVITFNSGGSSITTADLNANHPNGTVLYLYETSGTGDITDDDGTAISFTFKNITMVKDGTGNWRIMSFVQ